MLAHRVIRTLCQHAGISKRPAAPADPRDPGNLKGRLQPPAEHIQQGLPEAGSARYAEAERDPFLSSLLAQACLQEVTMSSAQKNPKCFSAAKLACVQDGMVYLKVCFSFLCIVSFHSQADGLLMLHVSHCTCAQS
jgi:hypothetical protein